MVLYLIGVDYNTADLRTREAVYGIRDEVVRFWLVPGKQRAALFTCNRIELYGISADIFSASRKIEAFRNRFPLIFEHSYVKQGNEKVVEHALRLAVGLESQLRGEREVFEQLMAWTEQRSFPGLLKGIWTDVLVKAEDISAASGLDEHEDNIAKVIFNDLNRRIDLDKEKKIAIIGTGKVARIFSENKEDRTTLYFVARKKHKRARRLARLSNSTAVLQKTQNPCFYQWTP